MVTDDMEYGELEDGQNSSVITSLASHVRACWTSAEEAKRTVQDEMLDSLQRRKGVYSASRLAEIRDFGDSTIFMGITDEKCNSAVSWITELLFSIDDKPWGIKNTPEAELPAGEVQEIEEQVKASMFKVIQDEIQAQYASQIEEEIAQGVLQAGDQASIRIQELMQDSIDVGKVEELMASKSLEIQANVRIEETKRAKKAIQTIETKLTDTIIESNWEESLKEVIDDMVTFKAGILKGPVLSFKKELTWGKSDDGTNSVVPVVENRESISFNRVSPFDIYPMPNARVPEDGIIEKHSLTRQGLSSLIGIQGYNADAIRSCLDEFGSNTGSTWSELSEETTKQELEDRPNEEYSKDGRIEALQYWGTVQGQTLLDYGLSEDVISDPTADYAVEVWLVGNYVIKAELNGDPLGRVPYHFVSFRSIPGSLWGKGIPEIIKDCQDMCNSTARGIQNNTAFIQKPQAIVDLAMVPSGEDVTSIYPGKVWLINTKNPNGTGTATPPITLVDTPDATMKLQAIFDKFSGEADSKSGIPKYAYGASKSTSGAMSTATGISIMMANASRAVKHVLNAIDSKVIKPTIERTHMFKLMFFDDPEYMQGDIKVVVKGTVDRTTRATDVIRKQELLQFILSSPKELEIIGDEGLANMTREVIQSGNFNADNIVPSEKEMGDRQVAKEKAQKEQLTMMMKEQAAQQQGVQQATQTNGAGDKVSGQDYKTV